jgi:predicted ATP-dependent protease
MAARELTAMEVGLPRFSFTVAGEVEVFDLSSHARAREALDFGLIVSGLGFNIFVMGEDRAGRMTATLAYLNEALAKRSPPSDWVYLNNFRQPNSPTPHRLPAGVGRRFRDKLSALILELREAFASAFTSEAYQAQLAGLREAAGQDAAADLDELRKEAEAHGLRLVQGEDRGLKLLPAEAGANPQPHEAGDHATERKLAAAMAKFQLRIVVIEAQLARRIEELNRSIADQMASAMLEELAAELSGFSGLAIWLTELRVDILENPMRFRLPPEEDGRENVEAPEHRYAVNLLVDHGEEAHPSVVLEGDPSYERLFGRIEHRQAQGTVQTDFRLIRAGSLHRANGGILVLRAEGLAANPASWTYLKAALRDQEIRIEELQRAEVPPIAGSPKPRPIPLDLKVVIVGAPRWYSLFFETDPEFQVYFKIKADIDPDMEASPRNLAIYAGLIRQMTRDQRLEDASDEAVARLLGTASRCAERRDRLTARIELIQDLVAEAAVRAHQAKQTQLADEALLATLDARHRRNTRIENQIVRSIVEGAVMIDTAGRAVGQVNALTVLDTGDWRLGAPVRVTARASVGRAGIINIERDVALGGPIQQKGAMVLQGFLAGRFAQDFPLSFTCSITFEQSYGGIEGDSASLAEMVAVLSDLAQIPIRQDVAITGSVNQLGQAQAIGGTHWKAEGFFRICEAKPGGLSGSQGVIVPEANRVNLVLSDDVAVAVAAGRFHLWSVGNVEEAVELLLGMPAGVADAEGKYPAESIFGRASRRLATFDRVLEERRVGRPD